jgi:Spy/CpxP family protein refolding chaperone
MTSIRRLRCGMASSTLVGCLLVVACGGESATGGGVAAAPPPSASVAPPVGPSAPPPPPASVAPPASTTAAPLPPGAHGAELAEGDEHRGQHHGGVLMLITASVNDLALGPDQRKTVDKIRGDLMAKMEPARAAGKDLANTLAEGVAAGAVDRAKADSAIGKLVTQVQGLHDASLTALNQLHAALDAQQRAALVDNVQSHWEKWKDAHGRDEDDDHQHRSGYMLALVRQLGLTKEQAEKIKTSFHDKMKTNPQDHLHKDVQDHLQAFGAAFKSDAFNAKNLTMAKAANVHMTKWGATRRARFLEAAAPVLTPEQRTKLAQEIRDRANRLEP